jgi:hypothetical protein
MIIDCHTHIFEQGRGGPLDLPAGADDLVRAMDENGVDLSIVLPLPDVATNEFVQDACARHPGRLIGLYTPEFGKPAETLTLMQSFLANHDVRGLKIHPRHQHIRTDTPVVREVLALAQERNLAVLFDVFPWGPDLDDLGIHPNAYHRLAQEMPDLRMVLAHAGGYKVTEAFLVAKSNPNVYLDISFTPIYFKGSSVANDIRFICGRLPAGRVLYGSDFPHVPMRESINSAGRMASDLDAQSRDELFGGAAATVFAIGQPDRPSA